MSQYLSFYLVNKKKPEIKVDLGYWCSYIARGISWNFNDIFKYTSGSKEKLDIDTLKKNIKLLQDGIERYKSNLLKEQEKKKENIELLLRAQSQFAVESIKEEIKNNENSINDWLEEIETWSDVENRLNFILFIFEKNTTDWELTYSNY